MAIYSKARPECDQGTKPSIYSKVLASREAKPLETNPKQKPFLQRLGEVYLPQEEPPLTQIPPQAAIGAVKQAIGGTVEGLTLGAVSPFPSENENEQMARSYFEFMGLTGPLSLAQKGLGKVYNLIKSGGLRSLARLGGAGALGASVTTAQSVFKEGELPKPEEVAKHGAEWMALDAVLQLTGLGIGFGNAVRNIAKKENVPVKDVISKLWQSSKNYVKSKFGRNIETPEGIVPEDAEVLIKEAQKAEKEGLKAIGYEEPKRIEFKKAVEKVSTTAPVPESKTALQPKPAEKNLVIQPKVTFKTAKGSIYEVEPNGTTTRNKAPRAEHPGEQGIQPTSQKTYYVHPKNPDFLNLGLMQTEGPKKVLTVIATKEGNPKFIGVKFLEGKDKGKFAKNTLIQFSEKPQKGLVPIETWNDGQNVHFGNEIVEVNHPESKAALHPKAEKPTKNQQVANKKPTEKPAETIHKPAKLLKPEYKTYKISTFNPAIGERVKEEVEGHIYPISTPKGQIDGFAIREKKLAKGKDFVVDHIPSGVAIRHFNSKDAAKEFIEWVSENGIKNIDKIDSKTKEGLLEALDKNMLQHHLSNLKEKKKTPQKLVKEKSKNAEILQKPTNLEPEHQIDFSKKMMEKQRDYIVDKIDEAIKNPPFGENITIKVPQDGIFKIKNSPDNLKLAKKRVERNWPVKPLSEGKGKPTKFSQIGAPAKLKEEKIPPANFSLTNEPPQNMNDKEVEGKVVSATDVKDEVLTLEDRLLKFKTLFVNQYAPLETIINKEAETFENPAKLAELVEGYAGQVKQALEHGQFDIETLQTIGPGFFQIFEPEAILKAENKKQLNRKKFRAYLAARSSLDRIKLGQKATMSEEQATEYIARHKYYEPLAKAYSNFMNQNLSNLRKAGIVSAEAEQKMREMYLNYAPLHRVIPKKRFRGVKSKTLEPEKLPKRAKGSEKTIIDPLETAVLNTAAIFKAIAKNKVMNAIRNGLEPLGYKVRPAPKIEKDTAQLQEAMGEELSKDSADVIGDIQNALDPEAYNPGDGTIYGFRDGKRWEMEVPQEIIDTVKGLNSAQSSFLVRILNRWRQVFSAGVVLQPATMLRLTGMDVIVSTLQSKFPKIPVLDLPLNIFYHFPKMLFEVIGKGELYQDYLKAGAGLFSLQGLDRESVDSMVTKGTNSKRIKELGLKKLAVESIKLPYTALKYAWKILGDVSSKLGDATRLIEYKKSYESAIGRGLTRSNAAVQAAHDAYEVSIPYGRQGGSMAVQEMYKIFPFMRTIFNSNISVLQALDPRNPNYLKFLSTVLAALTLPTIYFYMRNRNDPRYQSIPQEDRDRNLYIYRTDDLNEEPIRIRKMWQYGFIFQTLPERVLEYLAEKDPDAFEQLLKSFEYETSPFQFLSIASAFEDGFQFNKLFEGERLRIIPERQKRIDASLQHTQATTEVSKKLGEYSKISPIYIDFIIGNVGGGLGQNIARLVDEALITVGAAENKKPESKHADNVLWGTFFGRGPSKRSEQLNNFYRLHDRMTMIHASIKQLEKEGQLEKANKYRQDHAYVNTTKMRQRVSGFYTEIDRVLSRPVKTEDERRRKRLELDKLYNALTKEAGQMEALINSQLAQQRK